MPYLSVRCLLLHNKLTSPIDGVIAYTATATDKAGRSIPAPGKGVISTARQLPSRNPNITLDLSYRKRQLEFRRTQISQVSLPHEMIEPC